MSSSLAISLSHLSRFPNLSSSRASSISPSLAPATLAASSSPGLSLVASSLTISHICCDSRSGSGAVSSTSPAESKIQATFPEVYDGNRLLGVARRVANWRGYKKFCILVSGVYADSSDVEKLNGKYGATSLSELKDKEVIADILKNDIPMTFQLQIMFQAQHHYKYCYKYADSFGTWLKKFTASERKDPFVQKFVSLFKDKPKGIIELSKEEGYVLRLRIDGKEVGQTQSQAVCNLIFDLLFSKASLGKK